LLGLSGPATCAKLTTKSKRKWLIKPHRPKAVEPKGRRTRNATKENCATAKGESRLIIYLPVLMLMTEENIAKKFFKISKALFR
jgi:hypothetical protein